jgi:hypothetical protein
MEHYFCSLKALHKGAETIFKTLDAAFEVLSRQVTIVMPMKDIDRNTPNTNTSGSIASKPSVMQPSQRKYDSLGKTDSKPSEGGTPSKATGWDL